MLDLLNLLAANQWLVSGNETQSDLFFFSFFLCLMKE